MRIVSIAVIAALLVSVEASTVKKVTNTVHKSIKDFSNYVRIGIKATSDIEPGS